MHIVTVCSYFFVFVPLADAGYVILAQCYGSTAESHGSCNSQISLRWQSGRLTSQVGTSSHSFKTSADHTDWLENSNCCMWFRSALFLLVFLVVHMAGNLTFLFGPDAFNSYGHKLSSNPAILFIEAYLAASFLVHIVTASMATWRKKQSSRKTLLQPASSQSLELCSLFSWYGLAHLSIFEIWRWVTGPSLKGLSFRR